MTFLALAALFFVGGTAASASPPVSPAQRAVPTLSPAQDKWCLVQICLGENIDDVFPKHSTFSSPPLGVATWYLDFTVIGVRVDSQYVGKSTLSDPYDIAIGDTTDELQAKRGAPDQAGDVWRYGPPDGRHWLYAIKDGAVSSITVSALANVPD
jgi:hypothetical protein